MIENDDDRLISAIPTLPEWRSAAVLVAARARQAALARQPVISEMTSAVLPRASA